MLEAFVIIVCLGGLEVALWLIDHHGQKEQTQLLEDILVTLSVKDKDEGEGK